jgi:F-type H+-transporting ATPase subunit b
VFTVLAQASSSSSSGGSSGNFLVAPNLGVMIWTLIAFLIALALLRRLAFPRISEALEKRQNAIEESIDSAERTREEADKLLAEYRERLQEARSQADEIVSRARQTAENQEKHAKEQAKETIMATEKVTRKTLTDADQKRLVKEAIDELDFSTLSHAGSGD